MKATFRFIGNQVNEYMLNAEEKVQIAVAWFTNENLFKTLVKLLRKDISIELILNNDHINNRESGLDFNEFLDAGGKFYFSNNSNLMHHKFLIIDEKIVVSGSYNWTYNAEFRNRENILSSTDSNIIQQFINEFESLKAVSFEQVEKIELKPIEPKEYKDNKYLSEDYFYKSIAEEKNGNMDKSLEAIHLSKQLDSSNKEIDSREKEIIEKINNPRFHYHVEDGQFSIDFYENRLIGKEGEIVEYYTDRSDEKDEIYILYVDGFYIECIGNIERSFPKNKEEHDDLKKWMLEHAY